MGKKNKKASGPSDADLLLELATLDEASARIPTGKDHDAEVVPSWCELVLSLKRTTGDEGSMWPINTTMPLRRHDGELIIEVLYQVLHPMEDRSLYNMFWNALDEVIDRLVDGTSESKKHDQGLAEGLTFAIAVMANPYAYDLASVKEQAMERREARTTKR